MIKMLVVEDEPVSAKLLCALVQPYGSCDVAHTAEHAMTLVETASRPYDLVFLDICLPGADGIEFLSWLRALEQSRGVRLPQRCRVLMTTAMDDRSTIERAFQRGFDGYLVKPMKPDLVHLTMGRLGWE